MNAKVERVRCPSCGKTLFERVSQGAFQMGSTSIGPSTIVCACGTASRTDQSEWDEKSMAAKAWFVLVRTLWALCGGAIFGGIVSFVVQGILGAEASDDSAVLVLGAVGALVVALMYRKSRAEIRASQARTSGVVEPQAFAPIVQ